MAALIVRCKVRVLARDCGALVTDILNTAGFELPIRRGVTRKRYGEPNAVSNAIRYAMR